MGWKGLQSRSLLDEGYAMLSSLYASFFVALISCTGTSCHRRVSGVNEFLDFGDKTEEAGLNFIYSLMQDIKFLKQQFQQQDLHLLERLAASSETLMAGLCPLTSCLNCQRCEVSCGAYPFGDPHGWPPPMTIIKIAAS